MKFAHYPIKKKRNLTYAAQDTQNKENVEELPFCV